MHFLVIAGYQVVLDIKMEYHVETELIEQRVTIRCEHEYHQNPRTGCI